MRALESLCVVEMAFVVATLFTAYPRHASGSVVKARSGYRGQTTAKLTSTRISAFNLVRVRRLRFLSSPCSRAGTYLLCNRWSTRALVSMAM